MIELPPPISHIERRPKKLIAKCLSSSYPSFINKLLVKEVAIIDFSYTKYFGSSLESVLTYRQLEFPEAMDHCHLLSLKRLENHRKLRITVLAVQQHLGGTNLHSNFVILLFNHNPRRCCDMSSIPRHFQVLNDFGQDIWHTRIGERDNILCLCGFW